MTSEYLPVAAYERAERLLSHNRAQLVLHGAVRPQWIGDGSRFWYQVRTEHGIEFLAVEPEAGVRRAAFDHHRLARSLGDASGTQLDPYALPIGDMEITDDRIAFDALDARWVCRLGDYAIRRDVTHRPRQPHESVSPNGAWTAYLRGHDLWIRSTADNTDQALTTDGTADRSYATHPDTNSNRWALTTTGRSAPPLVLWSPDSTRLLTHRTDQIGVAPMHLVESAPADGSRPRLHTYRYPIPGETVPRGEWLIADVRTRAVIPASAEPFALPYLSPIKVGEAWWSTDGTTAYYLDHSRDLRTLRLNAIDAATGEVRTLIEETGPTRVEASQEMLQRPIVHVLSGGHEALWYSQRDGWGHLYRYDLGADPCVAQLTKGDFAVQEILHVDETRRVAYLAVSGLVAADPYRRSLVSVELDGGGMTRLTTDDLDHHLVTPPHGRWFVDSASTVDTPPSITVRDRDGSVLLDLERADISRLRAAGWTPPERVRTIAADGRTPIYGLLYKPHGFRPDRRYPVLDHTYPGPQMRRVEPTFDPGWRGHDAEAVAALGFAVLALDGRGTPGRDKAFHDHSYRNLGSCGGLDDHVAALRQLAESRPWMDLDRVGIFGRSGGGFATVRAMLTYPEVYKVGVAEAGNHDNRFYQAAWAETYDGPYDPDAAARLSNTELAENLTGRLLLIHGEMDDNVAPHLTMCLVDKLIAANKDFELLIVPGVEHRFVGAEHYVIRRRWDHLVRHLLRIEPPQYRLAPIPISEDQLGFIVG